MLQARIELFAVGNEPLLADQALEDAEIQGLPGLGSTAERWVTSSLECVPGSAVQDRVTFQVSRHERDA
jgi:hypothetical protein